MNRSRAFILVAVFAAMAAAGAAYAQGPGFGRGGRGADGFGGPGGPGGFGWLPLRQLSLSETQQQQIRDVAEQYRQQNQQPAEQLRAATDARRKAIEAMPVNEGLIRSTTQALVEAQTELAVQQARMRSEIFALLTATQQEQLKKLQADRESRIQQRERRGPRPQQPAQ
jgi:Spy/CpxP family protein refolding chaperone